MRIDRAAKFGIAGAIGVTAISLATVGLMLKVQADAIRAEDAVIRMAMVGVAGTWANLLFLFGVIGVFVDRKLAAHGLDSREE